MLHSLKKKSGSTSARARGVNPSAEFMQMKSKLSLTKRNLQLANQKMIDADRMWKQQLSAQRSFAEDFSEGFVGQDGDDTLEVLAEFNRGAQERYDHFVRSTAKEDETFAKMHEQLRVYIAEIEAVEARYPELVEAKSEVSRYQKKVDTIEMKKKTDDLKKERNLQKMDAEREKYSSLTSEIVAMQKATLAKSATAHNMAICSYWTAHEKHLAVLKSSMEKTQTWAAGVEDEMAAVDVATLDVLDNVSEVSQSESSLTASVPTSPVPAAATKAEPPKKIAVMAS